MTKFNKIKKGWFYPIIIFLSIIVLVFLVSANLKAFKQRQITASRIDILLEKIKDLGEQRRDVEAKISQSNLPIYLEESAREELNLKKPEEKVVAFPILSEEQPGDQEEIEQEKNLLQKVLDKLNIRRD